VWCASLDLEAPGPADLARHLSDDERDRVARFHFQRDATRFAVSRAMLRIGLSECLGVEPRLVAFRYGRHGKPELAPPFDRSGLRFNASRSRGLGLYALARGRRVGVDIERLRPLLDLDALAERVLSPEERRRLHRLPPIERLAGFFNCWTRKEAYLKAIGTGLTGSPARITVSLDSGAPARLERVDGDADAPNRWRLEAMAPDAGYVAAVAVEGGSSAWLTCHTWRAPST
jgi:4'-phosphopantetheinyl transferase